MHTVTHNPESANPTLLQRSARLNENASLCEKIVGRTAPVARYVNTDDCPNPPAPAWYLPATHSIYIHVNEALGSGNAPWSVWDQSDRESLDADAAKVLGFLAHEMGHAGISEHLDTTIALSPKYADLIVLLEELRVENHAVRRVPAARRWLRASFTTILTNLPDTFTSNAHVVKAWALTVGRTLAGVASPDETRPVDVAARTLLGDDVVDGLTDLLQEVLTLRTDRPSGRERLIQICVEWHELVGDPPSEDASGCVCKRRNKSTESTDSTTEVPKVTAGGLHDEEEEDGEDGGAGGDGEASDEEGDDEGEAGGGADTDDGDADEGDATGAGSGAGDTVVDGGGSSWGSPGAAEPDEDDAPAGDLLDDETSELMGMLARDLAELMADEWNKEPGGTKVANSAEWAAKVFGNRKPDSRLEGDAPTAEDRREVSRVAAVLSQLALPSIHKTPRLAAIPPGRLRSREALRGSAERSQGAMTTARPWHGTIRRHSSAKPVVLGVATDTSGSMRWAENAVARLAYVYTNAGHRIGARTAAVTFGTKVHRIARPGEVMDHVVTKSATDATEQFDCAAAALNGVLHLTDPIAAARLLVVVSDGIFVKEGESDRAFEWLRQMTSAGTHVVWVSDRAFAPHTFWLKRAETTMPTFSYLSVEKVVKSKYDYSSVGGAKVFTAINEAILALVAKLAAH